MNKKKIKKKNEKKVNWQKQEIHIWENVCRNMVKNMIIKYHIVSLAVFDPQKLGFKRKLGLECPTEIWTRIVGFRVQSANHYTMGPYEVEAESFNDLSHSTVRTHSLSELNFVENE